MWVAETPEQVLDIRNGCQAAKSHPKKAAVSGMGWEGESWLPHYAGHEEQSPMNLPEQEGTLVRSSLYFWDMCVGMHKHRHVCTLTHVHTQTHTCVCFGG